MTHIHDIKHQRVNFIANNAVSCAVIHHFVGSRVQKHPNLLLGLKTALVQLSATDTIVLPSSELVE